MKRALLLPLLFAVLLLTACGGGHRTSITRPATVSAHPCSTADFFMQCALSEVRPPALLAPTTPSLVYGIDFAWSCPSPSGHGFGASYLSTDFSKNWSRGCVNWWHSAGAKTVAVWETASTRAQDGYAAGLWDARNAAAQAAALGNTNRPIYFAVDFDTSGFSGPVSFPTPTVDSITSYFQGVRSVLGKRTGAYGGYTTINTLFNRGLINYGWQTYAWSFGRWDPRAQLEQYLNSSAVDYDRAVAPDYGQWPYTSPVVYPVCYTHRIPVSTCNTVKAKVASWQRAADSSLRAWNALGDDVLFARMQWFAQHVNKPPKSKHAYRARALASTQRAYKARGGYVLMQRYWWFRGQIDNARIAN